MRRHALPSVMVLLWLGSLTGVAASPQAGAPQTSAQTGALPPETQQAINQLKDQANEAHKRGDLQGELAACERVLTINRDDATALECRDKVERAIELQNKERTK